MQLNAAHEGCEYQDLLTSYFILNEVLVENDSNFTIDTKEYTEDKIDDLTITNVSGGKVDPIVKTKNQSKLL